MKVHTALIFKGVLFTADSAPPTRAINLSQSQLVHIKVNYLGCARGPQTQASKSPLCDSPMKMREGLQPGSGEARIVWCLPRWLIGVFSNPKQPKARAEMCEQGGEGLSLLAPILFLMVSI